MPPAPSSPAEPDVPASSQEARSAYVDQAVVGYLLYGVGAVTAFLALTLSLSDAAAALHSSLLAVGFIVAGLVGDRLDDLVGQRWSQVVAYLLLGLACLSLATTPAFVVTLTGAGMVGVGTGLLLAHVNRTLTRGGGAMARTRLGRAGLVAMVATLCVPIAVGAGENSGLGWQLVFVVAALLLAAGLWASRTRRVRASRAAGPGAPLPRRYWLAWWLIVLVVSVEFALVFWASTLVERRVGISLADATLVATGFYAGMATARVGLSFPFAGRRDPFLVIRAAMLVALTGSLLAWAAENVVTAAVGVYLAGLGTGPLYPLGISVALALVPGLQDRASARLILASGLAILVTPFVLGLGADLSSVSVAWLLVPVLCLGSLALTVPLGRARMQRTLATGVP